ncbi:MAG: glycosyltransferase [Thermoplasmata archaeon]
MKINYIMLIGIFILPAILTIFTMDNLILFPITHALWLTMEIGLITTLIFYSNYKKSIEIKSSLVNLLKNYKVVSLVVSYNEDPETVQNTLLSVKNETGKMGDVYLLDDSKHKKVEQNKKFCDENNIKYIHRENRRGYKAGALNDFLMIYGDNYDLISVFDLDQRPIKSFFMTCCPFSTIQKWHLFRYLNHTPKAIQKW